SQRNGRHAAGFASPPYRTRLTGRLIREGGSAAKPPGPRQFVTYAEHRMATLPQRQYGQVSRCRKKESAEAMQRGFLERPDCRLYYEVHGRGPFLVFAHGLGGNHLSWWQQVAHFAPRYTCVIFSHRGFAPSTAPAEGPDPTVYPGDLTAL